MLKDFSLELAQLQEVLSSEESDYYIPEGGKSSILEGLYMVVQVKTAFAGQGNTKLTVALQSDSVATFNSAALTTVVATAAIDEADLTANTIVAVVPVTGKLLEFIRAYFTVTAGPMTAGTVNVFLTRLPELRA